MVSFRALGGGATIGANCYQVCSNGHSVLLDCGIHPKKEGAEALPDLSILERAPDAVVISHGHIDHCGAVPYLLRQYPRTECYATQPTVQVMDRMLHNSVSVMGTLAIERGIAEYPLYTHSDVDFAVRRMYAMNLGHEFALTAKGVSRASFHHSGHVLGGASILLRMPEHSILYTGDICVANQELMEGLIPLHDSLCVDTLIIECTRGASDDRERTTLDGETTRFGQEIAAVLHNRGSVLVPSFALGRTQEMLNIIARLMGDGILPEVPVYASGLGRAIYEIYGKYPDYLKPGVELRPLCEFKRIGDVWERNVARDLIREPAIIVATSGMMIENTPSALIALEMVREKRHGIFFVGYLDPDTLGYRLLHARTGDSLSFDPVSHPVRISLENRQSFNFSSHATREDLVQLVNRISPKNVVFIHGDPDAVAWMMENTPSDCRKFSPTLSETLTLDA